MLRKFETSRLVLVTWNYIISWKLLVLNKNSWNYITVQLNAYY